MAKLTRKAFRAWLAERPQRVFHKVSPLVVWRGESKSDRPRKWPKWCVSVAYAFDNVAPMGARITAARCLQILDGIKP